MEAVAGIPENEDDFNKLSPEEKIRWTAIFQKKLQEQSADKLGQFVPYPKQVPFFDANHPCIVLRGGNRSGKTAPGMVFAIKYALGRLPGQKHIPPVIIWIVCPDFTNHVEGVLIPTFYEWCPPEAIKEFKKSPPTAIFHNGSKIFFKSSDSGPARHAGAKIHLLVVDEEIDGDVVEECQARLIDYAGIMRVTVTPVTGVQWLKDLCKKPTTKEIRVSMFDNPHINQEKAQEYIDGLPAHMRKTRELGDFLALSGLVFPEVIDPIYWVKPHEYKVDRDANVIFCLDPGYGVTACLWVALYPDDSVIVFDEYYQKNLFPDTNAPKILKKELHFSARITKRWIDPASKQHTTNPNSAREQYRQHGITCHYAQNDVDAGLAEVRNYLNPDILGHPRVKFYDTLVNLKEEFANYIYEPPGKSDRIKPRKKHDHLIDCLRYILFSKPRYRTQERLRKSWLNEEIGIEEKFKII